MTDIAAAHQSQLTRDPAPSSVDRPWSRIVMVLLALTGLFTPYICLATALVAFAVSDQDDSVFLASIGGAHLFLTWSLFGIA